MPIDRVDTLLEALQESQLLTPAQLDECRSSQSDFADTRALARHLLQRDWLTPYQVNHLLQGKADELFLDNYVLLERVGQGGMGQVFRARHRIMNRVVALKIIRRERLANPDLVNRFRREIQMAAKLTHPNIVIAYDAAEQNGTHFLVMEFVDGIDLARQVEKNGRRPVVQACEWIRQAALGLQHAHERGMVHRDIKPANLLLSLKDNVVKVLDMGLARFNQGADADLTAMGLTQEGTSMGTPDYMAPEQAEEATTVDIRADIYSLGCTLYFLLAGHVPFPGGTMGQKLRKHAQAEPTPLAGKRDDVPAGLIAIVGKMMAKRPADRYQTPGEVVIALEPFCRTGPASAIPVAPLPTPRPVAVPLSQESIDALGHPIAVPADQVAAPAAETVPPSVLDSVPSITLSKPTSLLARARETWHRLGRRNQILAGAAAAAVLLLLLLVVLWPKSPPPPQPQPELSVLERLDPQRIPAEDQPSWQSRELKDIVVAVLGEHRVRLTSANCLVLSPDHKKVAVGDGAVIRIVDTRTLREDRVLTVDHGGYVYALAYSANGKFLASGSQDKAVRLWDTETGKLVREFPGAHDSTVRAVALNRDGSRLLSGGEDTKVHVWAPAADKPLATFTGHKTAVRALAVSRDGKVAYSVAGGGVVGKDADRDIRTWEIETAQPEMAGEKPRVLTGHQDLVNRLEVAPDGKRLLAATNTPQVYIWDLTEDWRAPLALQADTSNCSADGTFVGEDRVATCASTGILKIWVPNGRGGLQDLDPLPPHPAWTGLVWVPADSSLLYVLDGTLHLWSLERRKELRPPLGHMQAARQLTFLGDGDWLVSAGEDRTVRFWNLADLYDPATGWPKEGRPTLPITPASNHAFRAVAVSRDGKFVLTVLGQEHAASVWVAEGTKWNLVRTLDVKGAADADVLNAVAISPDSKLALTAGSDKLLRLWDVERAVELKKIEGLPNPCTQVGFLAEGRAWSWDGLELRLWEGIAGDKPQSVAVPMAGTALALSPERDVAVTGQADGHLQRFTDLAKGKPLRLDLDWWQKGWISTLALSPDRKLLLAGSNDARFGLWELTRDPIPKPQLWDLRGSPSALTFAPDSRHAALANPDGTIYILRLPVGK